MKFHTQLKAKDIFKFSLAYTYSGVQAILTIFMLGVGAYMIVHGVGQPEGQTDSSPDGLCHKAESHDLNSKEKHGDV